MDYQKKVLTRGITLAASPTRGIDQQAGAPVVLRASDCSKSIAFFSEDFAELVLVMRGGGNASFKRTE